MTDSVKRTASKTAAGKGDAEPIAEAAEAAATPEQEAPADGATDGAADGAGLDETKRKFREALDRKRQVHDEGQGKGGHEAGKVSGAHGPAASRRSFRRKSG